MRRGTIQSQHNIAHAYSSGFCGGFLIFSFLVLLLAIGFYLASVNAVAVSGNEAHRGESEIERIAKKQRQMQIEMAELSSPHRLEEKRAEFTPIEPDQVLYIVRSGELAQR